MINSDTFITMAVSSFEVMSFVSKFLHVGTIGIKAPLLFDAVEGKVVFNLKAEVGVTLDHHAGPDLSMGKVGSCPGPPHFRGPPQM